MSHPFEEYDTDAQIGWMKWRIDRRADLIHDSQDGRELHHLDEAQREDRAKLKEMERERKERP